MKLAVSVLKSCYDEKKTIDELNDSKKVDYIHVDVMDGKFVKNKTKRYEYLKNSKKKLRVHLMVTNPYNYIGEYSLLNTESIIFHSEIEDDIKSIIDYIHERGLKAGLAIKPETSVKTIQKYLKYIDEVLVLTVEPGKGGQEMLDSTLYKLEILDKLRKEKKYKYEICTDGGINDKTVEKVKLCDKIVVGSFICMHEYYDGQIKLLKLGGRSK